MIEYKDVKLSAIHHLLSHCGNLVSGERLLLLVDETTKDLVVMFEQAAKTIGVDIKILEIDVADRHGKEPGEEAATSMEKTDLVVGLTKMSIAHTRARQNLCSQGGRYLSLPGYSESLLLDP